MDYGSKFFFYKFSKTSEKIAFWQKNLNECAEYKSRPRCSRKSFVKTTGQQFFGSTFGVTDMV